MKKIVLIAFLSSLLIGKVHAEDIDVYTRTSAPVDSNILIIFDNSGSMTTQDVELGDSNSTTTSSSGFISNLFDALNNLFSSTSSKITREAAAKEAMRNFVDNTDNARFGLMVFNYDEGGNLILECGDYTSKETVKTKIDNIGIELYTPLAETLANAGQYFAGEYKKFATTYSSPIQYSCQKNYIVYMTDGAPTNDFALYNPITSTDGPLQTPNASYTIDGSTFADESGCTYCVTGSYLDDIASLLYTKDFKTESGWPEKQNVVTYTVGFMVGLTLLENTAERGGGEYFTANNLVDLQDHLLQISESIQGTSGTFVAPVIPVSKLNRAYAGSHIYLSFFIPAEDGRWEGNIKKFDIRTDGTIMGTNNKPLVSVSETDIARSYWALSAEEDDGDEVTKGGAGERLKGRTDRVIYTYDDATSRNRSAITVSSDAATYNIITRSDKAWPLGDFIHTAPTIVHYSTKTIIYAGSNDGLLHCFDDTDGTELWAFFPQPYLSRISELSTTSSSHSYFLDGAIIVTQYNTGTQNRRLLIVGERRGGKRYYAFDIENYNDPQLRYEIGEAILGSETLGQSWAKPQACKIKKNTSETENVLILTGGYDTNQDAKTPASEDTVGRAVFAVKVDDGTLESSFNFNGADDTSIGMTHSILESTVIDVNGDGIIERIFAGDLGGNLFGFADDVTYSGSPLKATLGETTNGQWEAKKIFTISGQESGTNYYFGKKIFNKPGITEETFGDYIFFGTGDRENPDGETDIRNCLYAVKNNWDDTGMQWDDLDSGGNFIFVDVTDDLIQVGATTAIREEAENKLKRDTNRGWFLRLTEPGEKVVSTPLVYAKVAYFTTYIPEIGGAATIDPCTTEVDRGEARLYAVDYKTGAAVHDWHQETGDPPDTLTKEDRYLSIGTGIPSDPKIAIFEDDPKIFIGVEGKVAVVDPIDLSKGLPIYYWRQD